ncbi:MAG TPA: DUF3857 domain-containing protein [Opitutaceae bacterium]|nr:DUF3857 domain-containing protein [Opitutaceae bacterium]
MSCLAGVSLVAAKERIPEWLVPFLKTSGNSEEGSEALVLTRNSLIQLAANGKMTTRQRYAVRIDKPDGRKHAKGNVFYLEKSSQVKSFKAWIISNDGSAVAVPKESISDAAVYSNALELYGEHRSRAVSAVTRVNVGDVFAYEAMIEDQGTLGEFTWSFQEALPVSHSSVSVELPKGWQLVDRSFDTAPSADHHSARLSSWTMRSLPARKSEPYSPLSFRAFPFVAIGLIPPDAPAPKSVRSSYSSWREISERFTLDYDSAARDTGSLSMRAATLIGEGRDENVVVAKLARFVQEVNYISIALDIANAGGMKPRPADQVLRCNYGDCKDKASLLRALLLSRGIKSYPLAVSSGNERKLHPEWTSPSQFNHCILAIAVGEDIQSDAIIQHPVLGRLLVFDPTDGYTPLGLLADNRLASHGLLLAGSDGGLVKLPEMPRENNRFVREVVGRLAQDGSIQATMTERFFGYSVASARREFSRRKQSDFKQLLSRWLQPTVSNAVVSQVNADDEFDEGKFALVATFSSPSYGRWMQDALLVFKPALLKNRGIPILDKGQRKAPFVMQAGAFIERSEILIPDLCELDDASRPVTIETPFATYHGEVLFQDGKVLFSRELILKAVEIPAENYPQVLQFFERVYQAEQSPVVLRRKKGI